MYGKHHITDALTRAELQLDYLERIAEALETIAESPQRSTFVQNFTYQPPTKGEEDDWCRNDDPNIREKASPCVLLKGHTGDHKDSAGGEWMQ